MALEQKLSLKLAQKLVMTPSLQQAIKLLQMTRLELDGVLNQELEENPVLEEGEITDSDDDEPSSIDEPLVADTPANETTEALSEIDLDAFFGDDADTWENSGTSSLNEEREGPPLENRLSREPDLYDHLLWQLRMADMSEELREVAELVIGNLSPDGFLMASIEEIQAMGAGPTLPVGGVVSANAAAPELSAAAAAEDPASGEFAAAGDEAFALDLADPADPAPAGLAPAAAPPSGYPRVLVEQALALVRSFDPPGVACSNLQECLLWQLRAKGETEDSLACRTVSETWDLFTRRKFDAIARRFGVTLQDFEATVDLIRGLETRPGRQFTSDPPHYVEPDVFVIKVGDNYVIQLNDDGLPRLRVSGAYRKMLQAMRRDDRQVDAQQYIKEKMRSAVWLIKSLDQRQRTIYKVAASIVRQQRDFLDQGIERLRPMVLRDVADDIDMHESTVSRVVSNKYIHTPRGLFPMKFFFHSAIDREYGGDISSLSVKQKIQHFVQEEDPKRPLSDSELMRILKREGIQIARRTVAKYRDELGIPSSNERKQIF